MEKYVEEELQAEEMQGCRELPQTRETQVEEQVEEMQGYQELLEPVEAGSWQAVE